MKATECKYKNDVPLSEQNVTDGYQLKINSSQNVGTGAQYIG